MHKLDDDDDDEETLYSPLNIFAQFVYVACCLSQVSSLESWTFPHVPRRFALSPFLETTTAPEHIYSDRLQTRRT